MAFPQGTTLQRVVVVADDAGTPASLGGGGKAAYALLTNTSATGSPAGPVSGGDYIWSAEGTFGGATLALERQNRAGAWVAFVPAATLTAPGQLNVGVGQGAIVRVSVTGGSPSALYSDLAGL